MGYASTTYNTRVELGQKLAAAMQSDGAEVMLSEELVVNGEPSYRVIIKVASDVFIQYRFEWFRWYSRSGTKKYTNAVFTQMGSGYDGSTKSLSGQVSSNVGTNEYSYSSSERVHQTFPIPGTLHTARNGSTGELVFALENPADALAVVHGVGRMSMKDSSFGGTLQWYFDGEYSYRDANSFDRIPFGHNPSNTRAPTRSGVMQKRDASGTITGYAHIGNIMASAGSWSGYLPMGNRGTYSGIVSNLSFEPSLTSIFLPFLWLADPEPNKTTKTPRGDVPCFRVCNMKYLAVGQRVVYNSQEWRVFPCYGKGGSDTAGIAFLVGAAS